MPNLTNRPAGATTDLRIDSGCRLRRETIVKIKKRTHPFAMIDARALNDPRISWKAKGLHAYLMSKPKDWRVISEPGQTCHGSSLQCADSPE